MAMPATIYVLRHLFNDESGSVILASFNKQALIAHARQEVDKSNREALERQEEEVAEQIVMQHDLSKMDLYGEPDSEDVIRRQWRGENIYTEIAEGGNYSWGRSSDGYFISEIPFAGCLPKNDGRGGLIQAPMEGGLTKGVC